MPRRLLEQTLLNPKAVPCIVVALQVQHRYFLLVILTASVGDDLEQFRESIALATKDLALSIIVVGIGSADFSQLEVSTPL